VSIKCKVDDLAGYIARETGYSGSPLRANFELPCEGSPARHKFLLMLKPEALAVPDEHSRRIILETILGVLKRHGVSVQRVRLRGRCERDLGRLIRRLYPKLWKVSRLGKRGASRHFGGILSERFGRDATLLSAVGFLRAHADISAEELSRLADSVGCTKFGNGVYAVRMVVAGQPTVVLNPFAPALFGRYNSPQIICGFMECGTNLSWRDLRRGVVGGIIPEQAREGSIRRTLFERQTELGISPISLDRNAVHVSPGPIEARYQLAAAFGDKSYLRQLGLGALKPSHLFTVFDATEDLDLDDACAWMRDVRA
jgi:hypothetical protein